MDVEMYKFYTENSDFKEYVDKCMTTYNKNDVDAVFSLRITKEYMKYLKKREKLSNGEEFKRKEG